MKVLWKTMENMKNMKTINEKIWKIDEQIMKNYEKYDSQEILDFQWKI